MRILLWIIRALAILLLLRMVLRGLFGSRPPVKPPPGGGPGRSAERAGGELVRCSRCGTYVPKARAMMTGSGDTALYFCSEKCRDDYQGSR